MILIRGVMVVEVLVETCQQKYRYSAEDQQLNASLDYLICIDYTNKQQPNDLSIIKIHKLNVSTC